jgi:isopenicillin N synthase-like dioxygenase
VDFTPFLSLNDDGIISASTKLSPEHMQTAQEIHAACVQHGFVCLRNTGIPKSTLESTFQSAKNLFNLDNEVKKNTLKQINPSTNTGYIGFGKEALNKNRRPDLKEAFNIRNTSHAKGDFIGTPESFEEDATNLWNETKRLGKRFAVCCAAALGLDLDFFSKTLEEMDLCTMRMLHYPPLDGLNDEEYSRLGDDGTSHAIRLGEHTDFGIFTFLFIHQLDQDSSLGLQLKPVEGSDLHTQKDSAFYKQGWNDVVFSQEALEKMNQDTTCSLIVNTGALMARWTNDVWRATAHRVIIPLDNVQARLSHRYSIAMFFDPDSSTICSVHPKLVAEGDSVKYEPIGSLEYLMMKISEAQMKK